MGEAEPACDPASLLERLPDVVLHTDLAARLLWGNRAAEELFGRTLAESVGMDCMDLIHPDDIEMAIVSLATMQEERIGLPLELRVRTPTGWRQVELIGSSFRDGLLISIRDLTQRRRWEVAQHRTDLLRSVLQHLTTVAMVVESSGEVRATSAAITRLLGIGQRAVEGRHLAELVPVTQRDLLVDVIDEVGAAHSGAKAEIDVEVQRADSSTQPVSLTIVNLVDDPTVGGLIVTMSDISRRSRAERALREANAVLAATLESVSDGILAVDSDGSVRSWNRRFLEIWKMPEQYVGDSDLAAILDHTVSLAADSAAARQSILEVHNDAAAVHSATVELLDGRVIECRSRPQYLGDVAIGRVWSFRDVTAMLAIERDLEHRALHDPLTGLANQMLFRRNVESALHADDADGRCAVVFVDLDDFKEVNDGLGHAAGDLLLVEVAQRLRSVVRDVDTVARLGGDEFALLVLDVSSGTEALDVARRLHERLAEPVELLAQTVVPGASIGVAMARPGIGLDGLLRDADLAMYHAKRSGR
ncbi:MAG: diguanylate cyclase, partial [Actinobacteria bacterium]|nr:diguanylate cyclase [Actinomycetota bacterium]